MSRKIHSLLDKLERSNQLTQDGRNWLIAACDPFHDTDLALSGYPDVTSASTVVQLVKKQIVISAPGSLTAGANWDVNIVQWPTIGAISGANSSLTTLNTVNPIGQAGTSTP
jgi:hypothetical protein